MVSTASIVCMRIALLLTTLVPIGIVVWYCIRNRAHGVWIAALLGAAGFFVPQIVIRIPLLNVLSMNEGFKAFAENNYAIYALLLAATAAGSELIGRFAAAKLVERRGLNLQKATASGLAHGCIESFIVGGASYLNNLLFTILINGGLFDFMTNEKNAAAGVDIAQIEAVREPLVNTPAPMYLLGVYERGMTIILHLFMSMLVFYFMAKHRTVIGLSLCFLLHMLVDSVAGIVQGLSTPYLGEIISTNTMYVLAEGFITAVAIACIFGILKLRKKWGALHG